MVLTLSLKHMNLFNLKLNLELVGGFGLELLGTKNLELGCH